MLFRKAKPQVRRPSQESGRPKPAFSYYAGDTPQTKKDSVKTRQREERHQAFLRRLRSIPTLIALAIILLSVAYSTTLSTNTNIKFAGDPPPYRTPAEYHLGISKLLGASFWNKSKLTNNTHKTETAILAAYPELDAVNIALPVVGQRPTVTLHARTAAMLLTTQTNSYVLDISGKVVAESAQLPSSQRDMLLTVQDKSGPALHVGSQAVTSNTVIFIQNVQAQLKDKKLSITEVTLPATPNEVDFRIKDINYYIKTDTAGDARIEIGDFLAVKDSGAQPAEYMDVRVEEKVFYK